MQKVIHRLPVLYSFRRCPYAMRVRLAIAYAGIAVEIREIQLKQKPMQMLALSPKGTVPVLQLPDGTVFEESLDIMRWALAQNDPDNWLAFDTESENLIQWNDGDFKYYLDRYKYADRYPEFSERYYRHQAEIFLVELEGRLIHNPYLGGSRCCLLDVAIFPFIRQFAAVDSAWFAASDYQHLNNWLNGFLASDLFVSVMAKHPVWNPETMLF
nr:glutathione S-transferase [Crenothrix polyspora]